MRCINIDWLEVYCLEDSFVPHDAGYFRDRGWWVQERAYGTRVYAEMFTLMGADNFPLLEIRRKPVSSVLEPLACHVRLVNRSCYFQDAVSALRKFLGDYGFIFQRISRVDLALDFEFFDSGDDPQVFIRRYMKGKYAKINQSNLTAHGKDDWHAREFNSISWGAPSSPIGTKIYNKTLELREVKDKPYIRQAWFLAHLVDDPERLIRKSDDGEVSPVIWRLEFSIRSAVKNWVDVDPDPKLHRSVRNTLEMYDSRDKMLAMFASLVEHYFHFKIYQDGVTKYKCKDKELFRFGTMEHSYVVEKVASPLSVDRSLQALISRVKHYRETHSRLEQRAAADALIKCLVDEDMSRLCSNPWSLSELQSLQQALSMRLAGSEVAPAKLIAEIRDFIEDSGELF